MGTVNSSIGGKQMSEWLGLLDAASRADVLKVHVLEHEKTERERIEQEAQTKRASQSQEGYYWVCALFIVFLLAIVAGLTCVDHHNLELRALEAQGQQARARTVVPPAASSSGSTPSPER